MPQMEGPSWTHTTATLCSSKEGNGKQGFHSDIACWTVAHGVYTSLLAFLMLACACLSKTLAIKTIG
jgi:hypothetical protein